MADPVAMWHVRAEIAPAILLVVDFGGWYRIDSRSSNGSSTETIQHTQVSILKDVIVPYTHLLPRLHLSEDQERNTLLYFKGAKHRHRVSAFLDLRILIITLSFLLRSIYLAITSSSFSCNDFPVFLPMSKAFSYTNMKRRLSCFSYDLSLCF